LDYRTDANLRAAIKAGTNATTVIVAQRVSSVMHADYILVLEDGAVLAGGKHEELLATCTAYREISESQMGGAFLE
jgi:ATP-binding cassette subfamily B protein